MSKSFATIGLVLTAALLLARCTEKGFEEDASNDVAPGDGEDLFAASDLDGAADAPAGEDAAPDLPAAPGDPGGGEDGPDGAADGTEGGDATDAAAEEEALPPIRDDAAAVWPWHEQARKAIDTSRLRDAFRAAGYTPPADAKIIVGRIVEGVDQPAYQLYDLSGTAFSFSFWPASTVKLLATLGALDFMSTIGMTGDATVTIHYSGGDFTSQVWRIYDPSLRVSSNSDYDKTVEIAGFDRFNETFLSAARDLPTTVIQRRYGYRGSLRLSPVMDFSEAGRTATVPQRNGTGDYGCPTEGNCANLFELLNSMRRVVLHDEVPAVERFTIAAQDLPRIMDALLGSSSYFSGAAEALFGADAKIYNKAGYVPENDILDTGVIVDESTGDRWLVAVSIPEVGDSDANLSLLVRRALEAIVTLAPAGQMPWQRDAGIPIRVQLDDGGVAGGRRRIEFTIDAAGADTVMLWTDTWPLGSVAGSGPRFSFTYDYAGGGDRLLVLSALRGGAPVGYRAMVVRVPGP